MALRPLTPALQKKAEKEINENSWGINSDITALNEWLRKQPHLESVRPTDQWIIAFLRGAKFSLERTKEKLEMFYTLKTVVPEFFANRDPKSNSVQEILKLGVFLPLKNCKEHDSSRVCIMRIGLYDPAKFHLSDLIKVSLMITEILMLEDDHFTVSGEEVIVDLKNVGLNIISQWTPALAKKTVLCFEKGLPLRMRGTHILNTPPGFETAYAVFKTFLGEKLKKRLQVHNQNYKALYKSVPMKILPVEYGGGDGTIEDLTDYWKAKVESYSDWFVDQESAKTDESKRPGEPKNSSILFGVEGSFRKLEVD